MLLRYVKTEHSHSVGKSNEAFARRIFRVSGSHYTAMCDNMICLFSVLQRDVVSGCSSSACLYAGDAVKAAKVAQPATAQPATAPVQLPQAGAPPAPRSSWLGAGTSAVQQAWSFVTDEAAAVAAEGPDGVDRAVRHHVPMPRPFLHLGIQLQGTAPQR